MITIERSQDYALIRRVMTDPAVYPHIVDDFSAPVEEFQPVESDLVVYAIARDGEQVLGLFMLTQQNGITVEVHTCLLPCSYGRKAALAALALVEWVWTQTRAHRLVTNVPAHNPLALRFALGAGMEIFGVNEGSFQHAGVIESQTMLGLSRPKGIPCPQL